MQRIETVWDATNFRGDWLFSAATGSLESAVLISLFTDREADPDDVIPDGSEDPRGWWGDLGQDVKIGSKIWLRMRSKATSNTLIQVKDDIVEALAWLISDQVVARIDVQTEWTRPGLLGALVTLFRTDGTVVPMKFAWAWNSL